MRLYTKESKNKHGIKKTLWIDFSHQGKRYRKPLNLEQTKSNEKLAKEKLIPELMFKINNGEFFKNRMPTVNEYMKKSFELQKSNRKATTIQDYESKYNKHLEPVFGNKKLDTIKGTDITLWQNMMLEKRYAVKTVKGVRGILSSMFEDAIRDELIEKNPIRLSSQLSTRGIKKTSKDDIQPFSIEEIHKIVNSANSKQMKNLFMLLFTTGMRGGEAIGLKWSEVDFINNTIEIKRQITRGEECPPKWDSYRTIPIIDTLLSYLKSQYELTGQNNSFVFLNENATHFWDISKIRDNAWKKALDNANVEYRKIHQTRHTFCSTLISAAEDINYVSKIAGHSSTKMTLEVYSKYIPNKNQDFGKIFNESFVTE